MRASGAEEAAVGGGIAPSTVQDLVRSDKQVGVVVLDKRGHGAYAVAFASARDSGTAKRSVASLSAMRRDPEIPIAAVLSGPGWSHRNETADLAMALKWAALLRRFDLGARP